MTNVGLSHELLECLHLLLELLVILVGPSEHLSELKLLLERRAVVFFSIYHERALMQGFSGAQLDLRGPTSITILGVWAMQNVKR